MSDTHTPFDQPDPSAVTRTERFVDGLAKREPVDTDDRALAGLLEDWRDELRAPVPSGLCTQREAVVALNRGLAGHRRTHRRTKLVGAIAAATVALGGFGGMVAGAQPGETLYGMHTVLFGESASVHDERIAVSAETDLDLVEQMITMGQWDQAQDKLAAVSDRVRTVKDIDRKQGLIDKVNVLSAKVVSRDRHATPASSSLPAAAPATNQQPQSVGG